VPVALLPRFSSGRHRRNAVTTALLSRGPHASAWAPASMSDARCRQAVWAGWWRTGGGLRKLQCCTRLSDVAGRRCPPACPLGWRCNGTWTAGNCGAASRKRNASRAVCIEYTPKRRKAFTLTAAALVKRLLALVPPARRHLTRFHGVFGPNPRRSKCGHVWIGHVQHTFKNDVLRSMWRLTDSEGALLDPARCRRATDRARSSAATGVRASAADLGL
jgi:hypothetical protein